MPRYRVTEIRAREVRYVIDAVDERAAGRLDGTIIEVEDSDDYGFELKSVNRLEDEEDE